MCCWKTWRTFERYSKLTAQPSRILFSSWGWRSAWYGMDGKSIIIHPFRHNTSTDIQQNSNSSVQQWLLAMQQLYCLQISSNGKRVKTESEREWFTVWRRNHKYEMERVWTCVRVWVCLGSVLASSAYLVCVAGVGAGRRLGAGGGRGMSMGWGRHMEEGGKPGVYTHLSARYGVHC